jgi:hypothetical protein
MPALSTSVSRLSRLNPRLTAAARGLAAPLALLLLGAYLTRGYYERSLLVGNDIKELWLPTWTYLGNSLSSGHIPLWDPHILSGRPFAADPQSGWLYIMPSVLFTALPAHTAIKLMIALPPILASLALYAFCRIEGMPRIAGFCGGAALLGLTTPDAVLLRPPFEATILYAMTTLACAAWLLRARRPLARAGALVAFGLSYSQAISAHLSLGLLEVTLLAGGYLLVKVVPALRGADLREALRTLGLAAMVALATVLICAGPLLPRLALITRTNLAHGYNEVWEASLALAGLKVTSLPVQHASWRPLWPLWLLVDSGAQLPLLAGALVLIGLVSRRRGLALLFALLAVAGYLLTLSAVADHVPVSWSRFTIIDFYRHAPSWFTYLFYAAVALLTALGAERLVEWVGERKGGRMPAVAVVSGVVAVVLGVQLVLGFPSKDAPLGVPNAMWSTKRVIGRPLGYIRKPAFQQQFRGTGRIATYLHTGTRFKRFSVAFPAPADSMFDVSDITGSETVSGYDAVQLADYWRALRIYDFKLLPYDRTGLDHLSPAFADLLNVGWWVAPSYMAGPTGARLSASLPAAKLWRLSPPGLASLYSSWQSAPSNVAAQYRAGASGFDPTSTVLVPGLAAGGTPGPRPAVATTVSHQGTVRATTNATLPGLLLVRNTYDPGWHATVDGHSARVYAANGFLTGVHVPPGRHQVILTYWDPLVYWGLAISVVAVLGILGLGAAGEWRSRGTPPERAGQTGSVAALDHLIR